MGMDKVSDAFKKKKKNRVIVKCNTFPVAKPVKHFD